MYASLAENTTNIFSRITPEWNRSKAIRTIQYDIPSRTRTLFHAKLRIKTIEAFFQSGDKVIDIFQSRMNAQRLTTLDIIPCVSTSELIFVCINKLLKPPQENPSACNFIPLIMASTAPSTYPFHIGIRTNPTSG